MEYVNALKVEGAIENWLINEQNQEKAEGMRKALEFLKAAQRYTRQQTEICNLRRLYEDVYECDKCYAMLDRIMATTDFRKKDDDATYKFCPICGRRVMQVKM